MYFSAASIVLALAAVASAQNSTQSSTATATASLTPQQTCLARCAAADICCQAACVNVPCPSDLQANATTTCAAQCPQGNGSQEETEKYAACQSACIKSNFFSTGTAAAATGTASSSSRAVFGEATSTSGSSSRTGSNTASATASATANAAPEIRFGVAGTGLFGLFAVGLIL